MAFSRVAPALDARDRPFVHELTYGVARLRGRLDHLIRRCVRGDPARLEQSVVEVLRLGSYQLLYMGSVPRYAAVSQSVTQARELAGKGAGGLVNAVLRAVADGGDGLQNFSDPDDGFAGFLERWGSHPRWLVERWLARWSGEEVRALVEANNRPPRTHVVPLEVEPGKGAEILEADGIHAEPVGCGTRCLALAPGTDPRKALSALTSVVQDPGANLVVQYADVPVGTKVADLCAAPGGKALALSGRAGYTLAADRSEVRLRRVRENVSRTRSRVGMVVADALRPPVRGVDVVVLDVPCTGTGTLRRHPDARWRLAPGTLDELVALQARMLDSAAELVPSGGLLIYSTCSLEPEENADQVAAFLRRRPDFSIAESGAVPPDVLSEGGCLEVLPHVHGFDGAFAARLRRRA